MFQEGVRYGGGKQTFHVHVKNITIKIMLYILFTQNKEVA